MGDIGFYRGSIGVIYIGVTLGLYRDDDRSFEAKRCASV